MWYCLQYMCECQITSFNRCLSLESIILGCPDIFTGSGYLSVFFYRRDRVSLNYSISILLVWRKMLTSFMYRLIWAGSSEFGSYHLCEQRRFGRSCASPESQLLAQASNKSRGTFRQKARSLAPLNDWAWAVQIFHDQDCSKTQIRLTRPYSCASVNNNKKCAIGRSENERKSVLWGKMFIFVVAYDMINDVGNLT